MKISLPLCVFSLLIFTSSNSLATKSYSYSNPPCFVKGLPNQQPDAVCFLTRFLKESKNILEKENSEEEKCKQREGTAHYFYGPAGLGKKTAIQLATKEAAAILDYYDEERLLAELSQDKIPEATFNRIYRLADQRVFQEKKPVVIAMKFDKLLKEKGPKFVERMGDNVSDRIDQYKASFAQYRGNPYIVTIVVSDVELQELGGSFYRRVLHTKWENPTQKDRVAILKFYDPSLPAWQAQFLAGITRKFTSAELEAMIKHKQELENEHKIFPLMQSYWQNVSIEKRYKNELAYTALIFYTTVLAALLYNREKITGKITDAIKKYFMKKEDH